MPTASQSLASRLMLRARQQEIEAVRLLAGRIELVGEIGHLIHVLQRERGASSMYLASKGRRLADKRHACVDEARPLQQRLCERFETHAAPVGAAPAQMLSTMAWVLLGLGALDRLRERIERQAVSAHDSVAAYSRLIAGLVELVFHVTDTVALPSVSRPLVACLHLLQGKEAAGQERAVGALLFASGDCTEAHQQRLVHLIDAQERSLAVFAEFADEPLRDRWKQQQLARQTIQLELLRRRLCTARPGHSLDSNLSESWFDVCSERIAAMWVFECELVDCLRAECEAQIELAEKDLEDSERLLRRLRENPPTHAHAVERFFDIAVRPDTAPALASASGSADPGSLLDLLKSQAARMARMEAEFDAARRTLNERKVIERAKGVLMSRMGMTEEAAFRALQKTSMDQNRRLVEVAEATLSLPDFVFSGRGDGPR